MSMHPYDLISKPPQGRISKRIVAEMTNTNITDISYHPDENWLRIWFEPDLLPADITILDGIVSDCTGMTDKKTWQHVEIDGDLAFQKYISGEWVTKSIFGGDAAEDQPPEVDDAPVIFAPEMAALRFADPTEQRDIEGVSVADADSPELIINFTVTNGTIDFPFTSGATWAEVGDGQFTGTVEQLNTELAGLKFTPTNLPGPPVRPQDGTIEITLNDQDGATANAERTIEIEVLRSGRA